MFCALGALILSACSNPIKEDKDTLIRTLVDDPLRAGIYMKYWDGKDNNQKTVAPGTYICRFWAEDYGNEIEMNAKEGTSGKSADATGTGGLFFDDSRIPPNYDLEQNFPDPFYAKDGTNIRFEVPKATYIRLTIHTKS